MTIEIERKFLVTGTDWRQTKGIHFSQGYLWRDKERTVRVRVTGDQAFLTIKGITRGASRAEFEYEIPLGDAEQLLNLCDRPAIQKMRYAVVIKNITWEVDEFLGANAGLIIAEVELESEDQPFDRPSWLGMEVTNDPRYYNSNLVSNPFSAWSAQQNKQIGASTAEGAVLRIAIFPGDLRQQRHIGSRQLRPQPRKSSHR